MIWVCRRDGRRGWRIRLCASEQEEHCDKNYTSLTCFWQHRYESHHLPKGYHRQSASSIHIMSQFAN